MSITLHSPIEGNKKIEIPIAKPRTNTFIPGITTQVTLFNIDILIFINSFLIEKSPERKPISYDLEPLPFKRDTARKNFTINFTDPQILSKNESFKPANGARKLKEHELSYFGLSNVTAATKISNESPKNNRNDGKLTSDKPDLLINHSPNVERSSKLTKSTVKNKIVIETRNPIYENLKSMKGYDRKLDLERDEMILKELNDAADEVVKDVGTRREQKTFLVKTNFF